MSFRKISLHLILLLGACSSPASIAVDASDSNVHDGATTDSAIDTADANLPRPAYATELPTFAHYQSVADDTQRVKFTIAATGRNPFLPHACVFPDSFRYPYHLPFLRENFPDLRTLDLPTYASWILNRASRRMWGGDVVYRANVVHPTSQRMGVFGYTVYQELRENEDLSNDEVLDAQRQLLACAPTFQDAAVFIPYGRQITWATARRAELLSLGITVMLPNEFPAP